MPGSTRAPPLPLMWAEPCSNYRSQHAAFCQPCGRPTWQAGCCWQAGMLQPTAAQERREAEQAAEGGHGAGG